jgi:PAS domain S-box-containing protein
VGIQKIFADIDLGDPEIRYRDLYDYAPIAYFTVNAVDGRILNCNKAAQRLLDYPGKAMLQMNVLDLYADTLHGLPRAKKVFKDFKAGKSIRNIELQVKQHSGHIIWVSLSVEPEKNPDGKTIRSRSMMVDITDRKQAEISLLKMHNNVQKLVDQRTAQLAELNAQLKQEIEERKKSEENFKTLAENANDGIVLIEGGGNIVYVNNWFGKVTGYSVAELLKCRVDKLIDAGESEVHLEKLRGRLAGEPVPIRYETKLITKSGHALPVDITASKTIWHEHPACMLIVRDITSQKQTEAELIREQIKLENRVKERTKELVETNKALSVLARNIDRKRERGQDKTTRTVNSKILPIIEQFQKNKAFTKHRPEFDVLKAYLNELTAGSKDEPDVIFILSNAELRVATMIKNGFSSPEIARLLCVSLDTVKTHRKHIRRKLNISNSKINLTTYLRAKIG